MEQVSTRCLESLLIFSQVFGKKGEVQLRFGGYRVDLATRQLMYGTVGRRRLRKLISWPTPTTGAIDFPLSVAAVKGAFTRPSAALDRGVAIKVLPDVFAAERVRTELERARRRIVVPAGYRGV